ncbi:hypothetical protein LTS08_001531 [Lithohypha guttulata]|uniref:uncharacterized protein n=1 Tax=Lithohypha guttulata TaxID=1690604 RepID=UPI002DDF8CF4|nr:hypothetical protein LTR51_003802 [Lithohypha guttulata]KAK5105256.1 hypothetical protein LTS08_001531 [Lithohypha guttulata]
MPGKYNAEQKWSSSTRSDRAYSPYGRTTTSRNQFDATRSSKATGRGAQIEYSYIPYEKPLPPQTQVPHRYDLRRTSARSSRSNAAGQTRKTSSGRVRKAVTTQRPPRSPEYWSDTRLGTIDARVEQQVNHGPVFDVAHIRVAPPPRRSSHDLRMAKARSIFETDPQAAPIYGVPYDEDSRKRGQCSALYHGHLNSGVSKIISPDRSQFLERQEDIDQGIKSSWWGFGQTNSSLSLLGARVAQEELKGVSYYPRVQKFKNTMRLLERRNTLDRLTYNEQEELISWWQSKFGKSEDKVSSSKRVTKAKKGGSSWNPFSRHYWRRRRERKEEERRREQLRKEMEGQSLSERYNSSIYGPSHNSTESVLSYPLRNPK